VSDNDAGRNRLFATTWVHVFEEDTAEGAVYRPSGAAMPLSRRPRERLELHPDGTARVFVQGPDDRYVERPATWQEDAGAVVIRAGAGGAELRIIEQSSSRLVVKTSGQGA
jgi:hypothetical protein